MPCTSVMPARGRVTDVITVSGGSTAAEIPGGGEVVPLSAEAHAGADTRVAAASAFPFPPPCIATRPTTAAARGRQQTEASFRRPMEGRKERDLPLPRWASLATNAPARFRWSG